MAARNPYIAFFLVYLLIFQSVTATGEMGCRHNGESRQAGHMAAGKGGMDHALHHYHNSDDVEGSVKQSDCTCGCYCTGACMHACQGPSLITAVIIQAPDLAVFNQKITTNFSKPGFTTHPFRPPTVS